MQNFNAAQTRESITAAFTAANAAYVTRNGEKAQVNEKTGFNDSIYAGFQTALKFTDAQLHAVDTGLGLTWESIAQAIAGASNVKKAMRIPQFLLFCVSGDGNALRGSAKTAFLAFAALMCEAKTRAGIAFGVTGKGNEHTSDAIRGYENARKVLAKMGGVDSASAPTQISVAMSRGGILPALGVCEAMPKGAPVPAINGDSKLAQTLATIIAGLQEGTIDLLAEQAQGKQA